MDKLQVPLNPNATPFIPKFKRASDSGFQEENMAANVMFHDSTMPEETQVHEVLDPASQTSTDSTKNLMISGEGPSWQDYQMLESVNHLSQYETMGIEKQELEDSSIIESEYLSSMFPNLSSEFVNEVYHVCGDVIEAKLMLEQLEGHDVNFDSFCDDPRSSGTASSISRNDITSDSVVPQDSGAVQPSDSANTDSA